MDTRTASPKQISFIRKLLEERSMPARHGLEVMPMREASALIDSLLKGPRPAAPQGGPEARRQHGEGSLTQSPSVDLGGLRSAVYATSGTAYQIDVCHGGRWEGWVFVKTLDGERVGSQRPGSYFRAAPGLEASMRPICARLVAIASDPVAALVAYALDSGRCGACGRELTDDLSRAAGIGPTCAQVWGVDRRDYQEVADRLRAERERRDEAVAAVAPTTEQHQAAEQRSWDDVAAKVDQMDLDQELAGIARAGVLDLEDNPFDFEPDFEPPARPVYRGPDSLPAIPSVMDGDW